ncbi:MAG: hypothetical protein FK732_00040, partial [Asgard group archaeon]|nr:hypothetical protein [Asgard group archaeon]
MEAFSLQCRYPSKDIRRQIGLTIDSLVKELRKNSDLLDSSIHPLMSFIVNYIITLHLIGLKFDAKLQKVKIDALWENENVIPPVLESYKQSIRENSDIYIPMDLFRKLKDYIGQIFQESCFWDAYSIISETTLQYASQDSQLMSKSSLGKFPTPYSLASYIMLKLLQENLDSANLDEILRIRILDPAAGSGIFVGIAHDILSSYYQDKKLELGEKGLDEVPIGDLILRNNLYAVDISQGSYENLAFGIRLRSLLLNNKVPEEIPNFRIGNSLIDVPHQLELPSTFLYPNSKNNVCTRVEVSLKTG